MEVQPLAEERGYESKREDRDGSHMDRPRPEGTPFHWATLPLIEQSSARRAKHTQRIFEGAPPWLDTPPPLGREELSWLLEAGGQFRNALMHFEEKTTRPAPDGYVAMTFGFDRHDAKLVAPVGKEGQTGELTRYRGMRSRLRRARSRLGLSTC
jgi:hypothetical protein